MQTPLSSRLVYEGRIFDVTVDRVQLPHGRQADLEIVRHDGSVVLLPIADDGRVLLVRQYHTPRTVFCGSCPPAASRWAKTATWPPRASATRSWASSPTASSACSRSTPRRDSARRR